MLKEAKLHGDKGFPSCKWLHLLIKLTETFSVLLFSRTVLDEQQPQSLNVNEASFMHQEPIRSCRYSVAERGKLLGSGRVTNVTAQVKNAR